MSRNNQPKKKKPNASQQQFYHSEEVLNSDRFFLVGRGGHGNFHKGNRAVRTLVADHALQYVETPRKDRAQISIGLFDNHSLFQTLLFVTPRDYVLPRLEKDEEAAVSTQTPTSKAQGITLPNGATIPPTLSSQKRWLSRTRTQSIIDEHGSISNIRAYPRGVYIEVGRDWAIDIIDHLCREQAHEIRKNKNKGDNNENAESVEQTCSAEGASQVPEYKIKPEVTGMSSMAASNGDGSLVSAPAAGYPPLSETCAQPQKMYMDRARALASPDMMEAVEGLSALMGSTDGEMAASKPHDHDVSQDGYSDSGTPSSPLGLTEDDAVVTTGGEIMTRFPEDMHFVCGCVGFSVLDNHAFLKLIENYYHEQIDNDANFRKEWEDKLQKLKVRRHVPAILARAGDYAKSIGKRQFRLWTAQRDETNGGRLQRLSEEVWSQARLVEITENTALLKQRLESPLRSILMSLKRYPSHLKEENGVIVANGVERLHYQQDSGQSSCSASDTEDQVPENNQSSSVPCLESESTMYSSVPCLESESSIFDSRKRPIASFVSSLPPQKDWRSFLPIFNFEPADLGEPPSGWLFCRERAIKKLTSATQVTVVIASHHTKEHGTNENHFVWEAASRWRKELPAKRFICWFDASNVAALGHDFGKFTRGIRQNYPSDKKAKYDLVEAVQDFYEALAETRSGAEFFMVFCSAPDPATFASWVLPKYWYDESGNLLQDIFSQIVIVPKQQTPYRWNPDVFRQIEIHTIHRIPDKRWKDEKEWWRDLPVPNLPPMFPAEIEAGVMEKVRQALEMDGSLVALLNEKGDQSLPSAVANQFVRKWMMEDATFRFGFWLSAKSEQALRKSYIRAICSLTRLEGFDDEVVEDISPRWLAKELMDLLMHMRKFTPRFQWVVVFSDIPSGLRFEEWFFPSESEWWNSRGRFAFTSAENKDLKVTVGVDGADSVRKVPVVTV
ncbi:hypothetical protein ACA910_001767 [Epithemia clementina (nom. ined.)]